jgi:hypothetical protein
MFLPEYIIKHLNDNGVTSLEFIKWAKKEIEPTGIKLCDVDLDKVVKGYFEKRQYKHQLLESERKEDFWVIPVSWTVVHKIYVPKESAEDLDAACAIAKASDLPPEEIWQYCDDSFQIDVAYLAEENDMEEDNEAM